MVMARHGKGTVIERRMKFANSHFVRSHLMSLWLHLVCILVTCACAWLWRREIHARKLFADIPHYPMLPIIGNLHQFYGDGRVVQDPEDIKTITNAFLEKPYYYSFGRAWLGNGLVTAPGFVWKHNIKKLAGAFTTTVVDGYQGVFNAQGHKLAQNLKVEVGKAPFNILNKYLAYTTLEAICQTALGVSEMSERIVTTEYYEAFNRGLELLIQRGLNVFLHPDFIYRLTPACKEYHKCLAVIHNVSDTVIKERKLVGQRLKKNEIVDNDTVAADEPKFKSFLEILLEMSENDPTFTEQQIKAEVDTIVVGGQETVATTIFYTLLMIGCKPKVQEKLYAEVQSVFGDSDRPVTKDDLSRMRYCEAVLNETLRMFPPLPAIMRYADRDLQIGSCKIPKGCAIAVNVWGAGRSARTWGYDAQLYRPDRWLADYPPGISAGFLAFSYGRRACIGKKYAMALLKTVLAYCVRDLEFVSQANRMELKVDIALRPISGHLIQVRARRDK